TWRLRFGRIGGQEGGHGELVDELAVDEQAFGAAAFHRETHALVEAGGARGVGHHGEPAAGQGGPRRPPPRPPPRSRAAGPARRSNPVPMPRPAAWARTPITR